MISITTENITMNTLKLFVLLTVLSLINACSTSTPSLVSELDSLQIPVAQASAPRQNMNEAKTTSLYNDNDKTIRNLMLTLKDRYLRDVTKKDIFDAHSFPHRVYGCLAKLEQASKINMLYLSERNTSGLVELHKALEPVSKAAD